MKRFVAVVLFVVVSLSSPVLVRADDRHIRPGDTGAAVMALQGELASLGYTVAPDGRFGPQTERAVRHWQKANRLVVDGIVGPVTAATLAPAKRVDPPQPPPQPRTPEQIIRDVWPDDVEDHAVAIAFRESRLTPTARNACCFGLFQINYGAHRGWLGRFGVNSPTDLLDPTTNAVVAFALFQAAGWDPWKL